MTDHSPPPPSDPFWIGIGKFYLGQDDAVETPQRIPQAEMVAGLLACAAQRPMPTGRAA